MHISFIQLCVDPNTDFSNSAVNVLFGTIISSQKLQLQLQFRKMKIEFQKIQLLFSKFEKNFLNSSLQSVEYSDTCIWKF